MEKERRIVCCQGGLGDHLAMSTFPEEWSKSGYDVYLSSRNLHRNMGIYQLVWEMNPFVKGFVEGCDFHLTPEEGSRLAQERKLTGEDFVGSIERMHGILETGNTIPKLYRQHNRIPELENKTILNFQAISSPYSPEEVLPKLQGLLESLGVAEQDVLHLQIETDINTFKDRFYVISETSSVETSYPRYTISDIFHHCDVIHSCKNYICLHSGGAVLASAVNNPNTYVIMKESLREVHDTKTFIFPNQKYIF